MNDSWRNHTQSNFTKKGHQSLRAYNRNIRAASLVSPILIGFVPLALPCSPGCTESWGVKLRHSSAGVHWTQAACSVRLAAFSGWACCQALHEQKIQSSNVWCPLLSQPSFLYSYVWLLRVSIWILNLSTQHHGVSSLFQPGRRKPLGGRCSTSGVASAHDQPGVAVGDRGRAWDKWVWGTWLIWNPHLNRKFCLTQGCVADISLDTSDGLEAEPSLFPLRASEGRLPIYEVPSKLAVMSEVSKWSSKMSDCTKPCKIIGDLRNKYQKPCHIDDYQTVQHDRGLTRFANVLSENQKF